MTGSDPIDLFLSELSVELRRLHLPARAIGEVAREVEDHLDRAARSGHERGLSRFEAATRAVDEFGDPRRLAADWTRADRRWPPRLCWGLFSAAGVLIGLACGVPAGMAAAPLIGMMLLLPVVGGVAGSFLGLGQWFVLRRHLAGTGWWVFSTAAALAIGLQLGTALVEALDPARNDPLWQTLALALIGAVVGAALGSLQWRSLAGGYRGAGIWVLANAGGLAAGMALGGGLAIFGFGEVRGFEGLLTITVFAALTLGLSTSMALADVFQAQRGATSGL